MHELLVNPIEDKIAELKKTPANMRSENLQDHTGLHIGPAIAISYAHHALEHLKGELGNNLVAAYVVGKAGRNSSEQVDKVKLNVVVKGRGELPDHLKDLKVIPKFGSVQPSIMTESELKELLEGSSPQAKRHRADLALDNIALHGIKLVRELRHTALLQLQEDDFEPIISTQARTKLNAHITRQGKNGIKDAVEKLKIFKNRARSELQVEKVLDKAKQIQKG